MIAPARKRGVSVLAGGAADEYHRDVIAFCRRRDRLAGEGHLGVRERPMPPETGVDGVFLRPRAVEGEKSPVELHARVFKPLHG